MTTTIEQIHQDPGILDRAIANQQRLEIISDGQVKATLVPKVGLSIEDARQIMKKKFASSTPEFIMSTTLTRDERNSRD